MAGVVTYDEVGEILDGLAEELPSEFYEGLNGGVVLNYESKPHPDLPFGRYWILGEYVRDGSGLGNHVVIYYGSFVNMFSTRDRDVWVAKLREVLRHEFRHHVEGRAGVRDLEVEDEVFLANARAAEAARAGGS